MVQQPAGPPVIDANGITGAGGSVPPVRALSPGGLMLMSGIGFLADPQATSSIPDGQALQTVLLNTCVLVNGARAPLASVSATQVKFAAPVVDGKNLVDVIAVRNCDQSNEIRSDARQVAYQAAAPEFVFAQRNPDGRNPVLALRNSDGSPVGTHDSPATPGDVVMAFGLGFGLTDPPVAPGDVPSDVAATVAPVTVQLGDSTLDADAVQYAGLLPGFAGLYEVQFEVPAGAPPGDLPLAVTIAGATSLRGAYLSVGAAPSQ